VTAAVTSGSAVTTTTPVTPGAANAAATVSCAIASTSASCRPAPTAPRSRVLAAANRFTGTSTDHSTCR
jgi:hypothetical protein